MLSVPDFVSQLWRKIDFLQSYETKSGTESMGSRLHNLYLVDGFLLLPANNLFDDLTISLYKPACTEMKKEESVDNNYQYHQLWYVSHL